jgi:two-component system, chemotaxis family, protein-glutamate methylesterase/glutaminase
MAPKPLIVVGASAGGVKPLQTLVAALPEDLKAAVLIVLHLGADTRSYLPQILQRKTGLPVAAANDNEQIRPSRIYVARPDEHLVVEGDRLRNTRGPKENRVRPAIDALFRSAAYTHSEQVIGVILSGTQDDGTAGLWSVKDRGGIAMVQDPADAEFDSMPRSAMEYVKVDHVASASQLGPLIVKATQMEKRDEPGPKSKEMEIETRIATESRALQLGIMELGPMTPYTCPECHGVLVQLKEGGIPRFRCHTGHAYSLNSLLAEVTHYVEDALWNGMRAIEESMILLGHLARHIRADTTKDPKIADLLEQQAKDAEKRVDAVRKALMTHESPSEDNVVELSEKR